MTQAARLSHGCYGAGRVRLGVWAAESRRLQRRQIPVQTLSPEAAASVNRKPRNAPFTATL